jgi:hypothetical protein
MINLRMQYFSVPFLSLLRAYLTEGELFIPLFGEGRIQINQISLQYVQSPTKAVRESFQSRKKNLLISLFGRDSAQTDRGGGLRKFVASPLGAFTVGPSLC